MAAPKLYLDEDVHGFIAQALRLRGREVLTTYEAGNRGFTDKEQIEFAIKTKYAIVSYNICNYPRHHYEILARGDHHFGMIVGTQEDPKRNLRALLYLVDAFTAEDFEDQLLYLNNWI